MSVFLTDIIPRFGLQLQAGACQRFSTVPYHTVSTHLVSVQGQTPQTVTVLTVQNGLMSLAPTNGASVWLGRKNPVGKIDLSKWVTCCVQIVLRLLTTSVRVYVKRVRRQVLLF
jgi:hypothetical protein